METDEIAITSFQQLPAIQGHWPDCHGVFLITPLGVTKATDLRFPHVAPFSVIMMLLYKIDSTFPVIRRLVYLLACIKAKNKDLKLADVHLLLLLLIMQNIDKKIICYQVLYNLMKSQLLDPSSLV